MYGEPTFWFFRDSGAHIYSSGGKKHHSMTKDLESHAGYPNVHDFTDVGGHHRHFKELLVDWVNRNIQFALPQSGKPGERPRFGRDFVVLVIDANNGLQMLDHRYTGPGYISPAGESVYDEYGRLMEKLHQYLHDRYNFIEDDNCDFSCYKHTMLLSYFF